MHDKINVSEETNRKMNVQKIRWKQLPKKCHEALHTFWQKTANLAFSFLATRAKKEMWSVRWFMVVRSQDSIEDSGEDNGQRPATPLGKCCTVAQRLWLVTSQYRLHPIQAPGHNDSSSLVTSLFLPIPFSFYFYNMMYFIYLCVSFIVYLFLLKCKLLEDKIFLCFVHCCLSCLEQTLAQSKHLLNICWVSEANGIRPEAVQESSNCMGSRQSIVGRHLEWFSILTFCSDSKIPQNLQYSKIYHLLMYSSVSKVLWLPPHGLYTLSVYPLGYPGYKHQIHPTQLVNIYTHRFLPQKVFQIKPFLSSTSC